MTDQENYPIILVCIFAVAVATMVYVYVYGCVTKKRRNYTNLLMLYIFHIRNHFFFYSWYHNVDLIPSRYVAKTRHLRLYQYRVIYIPRLP